MQIALALLPAASYLFLVVGAQACRRPSWLGDLVAGALAKQGRAFRLPARLVVRRLVQQRSRLAFIVADVMSLAILFGRNMAVRCVVCQTLGSGAARSGSVGRHMLACPLIQAGLQGLLNTKSPDGLWSYSCPTARTTLRCDGHGPAYAGQWFSVPW